MTEMLTHTGTITIHTYDITTDATAPDPGDYGDPAIRPEQADVTVIDGKVASIDFRGHRVFPDGSIARDSGRFRYDADDLFSLSGPFGDLVADLTTAALTVPAHRETVWCEAHGDKAHFETPDCRYPHYTDTATRDRMNAGR